jgi:phage terminase large subunit-like protein
MSAEEVVYRFGGELAYVASRTPLQVDLITGRCERCGSRNIRPLPGPQTQFLASRAKVALFGGSAGGGKTYALLLSWLRHANTRRARGLIARNTQADLTRDGGLWGEAETLYLGTGPACPRCPNEPRPRCIVCKGTGQAPVRFIRASGSHKITWPGGGSLEFAHLKGDAWKRLASLNLAWAGIEEAVECSMEAIIFVLSRLRTTVKGIAPALRMTTNPDPGHPLRRWVEPYLRSDGEPDFERSGDVLWLARSTRGDRWISERTPEAAKRAAGSSDPPLSFQYFPALLTSNIALEARDPGLRSYRASLAAQGAVRNAQLSRGNWLIREAGKGTLSRMYWGGIAARLREPLDPIVLVIRAWDKAASEPSKERRDPDWTSGLKVEWDSRGRWYLSGLRVCRRKTTGVDSLMAETSYRDGRRVIQVGEVDPGQAGLVDEAHTRRVLSSKFVAKGEKAPRIIMTRATTNKIVKVQPVARELELGMRSIPGWDPDETREWEPRGYILEREGEEWIDVKIEDDGGDHPETVGELLWEQLEEFPNDGVHDDIVDTLAIAHAHKRTIDAARAGARKPDKGAHRRLVQVFLK